MNETLNIIANRYSCRSYKDEKLSNEIVEALSLAAVKAPSSMNKQPWEIIVITDKSLIDEFDQEGMHVLSQQADKGIYERMMERGGKLFYNAPVMFIIAKKPKGDLDVGIVAENIAIAATSLGLGSCHCGMARLLFMGEKQAYFKEKLGLNEELEFGLAVLVGYANEEPNVKEPNLSKLRYIR